jgi:hypothetical protein
LVLYYGVVDEDEVNKHCRDGAAAARREASGKKLNFSDPPNIF